MSTAPPVILIVGPTAGGKTALSIELANTLPGGGECICADSMQIYRGMDIGTAKPTPQEQSAAPHHLLDLVDPSETGFSVDVWLQLAKPYRATSTGLSASSFQESAAGRSGRISPSSSARQMKHR